jgi:small subunit ribosomal protein S20
MPRRKSSIKRKRADAKKHLRNLKVKKDLKKTIKKFQVLLLEKKVEEAKAFLKNIFSALDKAAKKEIIPRRTANRKKSRLSLGLKRISA